MLESSREHPEHLTKKSLLVSILLVNSKENQRTREYYTSSTQQKSLLDQYVVYVDFKCRIC